MSADLWLRAAGYQVAEGDSTPLEYEEEWPVPPGVQVSLMLDNDGRYVLEFKTANQGAAQWMIERLSEWGAAVAGDECSPDDGEEEGEA